MQFLNEKYLSLLKSLLSDLEKVKVILNNVNESGNFSNSTDIIHIYENLFSSAPVKEHVEFKITFIGKSTHYLVPRELSEVNANRHLTLNLVSKEAIWIDQLYENRITDLLKFFKHLFSAIENFSIYQNTRKLKKFATLIDKIKGDITSFVSVNIDSDQNQTVALLDLQNKERNEINARTKGVKFKTNWQLFVNVILDHGIEFLYHFTDASNLPSIKEKEGLYSWAFCKSNDINIPMPGGNSISRSLDKRKGAENYVRFSFCKNHPMEYIAKKEGRITKPIKLLCDTELIYLVGTKFCNMNATKNEAILSDKLEYFQDIDFSICRKNYLGLNQAEKSTYQSEVLVYEHVPSKYILNIDKL